MGKLLGNRALIAMSGGVDSSVAAYLTKEHGFDIAGVTLKMFGNDLIGASGESTCCSTSDVEDAESVCRKLGVPFYVFNFADRFEEEVVRRFVRAYEEGKTPNPCIDCNRYLKFGALFQRMEELGFDYIVTGHYARVERAGCENEPSAVQNCVGAENSSESRLCSGNEIPAGRRLCSGNEIPACRRLCSGNEIPAGRRLCSGNEIPACRRLCSGDEIPAGRYLCAGNEIPAGRYLLKKAADPKKDQSYVLFSLTQEQLAHVLFPLGGMTKDETRKIAEEQGFINAHKHDSQDICFVPDGDYTGFIKRYTGKEYEHGDFVDEDGSVLGEHKGLIRYTIGQRKGLGLALPAPLYVCRKDTEKNQVVLAPNDRLYKSTLEVEDFNWIAFDEYIDTADAENEHVGAEIDHVGAEADHVGAKDAHVDTERPKAESSTNSVLPGETHHLRAPFRAAVKVRYSQKESPATVTPLGGGRVRIDFDEPVRAITPGQAAVVYDGDIVIGGGTIE